MNGGPPEHTVRILVGIVKSPRSSRINGLVFCENSVMAQQRDGIAASCEEKCCRSIPASVLIRRFHLDPRPEGRFVRIPATQHHHDVAVTR